MNETAFVQCSMEIVTDDKIDRNYIKAVSVAVVTPSSSLQFKDDGRWMIAAESGVVMLALGLTVSSLRRCLRLVCEDGRSVHLAPSESPSVALFFRVVKLACEVRWSEAW